MINLDYQLPGDVLHSLAQRVRVRRRERKWTQQEMADRAGMSLGSYKRFEQTGHISLDSLVRIAFAFGCPEDFDSLFAKKGYSSIEEVINAKR